MHLAGLVGAVAIALGCSGHAQSGAGTPSESSANGGTAATQSPSEEMAGRGGDGALASGGHSAGESSSGGAAVAGAATSGGSAGVAGAAVGAGGGGAGGASAQSGACSTIHHVEVPLNLFSVELRSASYAIARVGSRFSVVEQASVGEETDGRAVALVSWQGIDTRWECTTKCPRGAAVVLTPDAGDPQILVDDSSTTTAWDPGSNQLGTSQTYWPEMADITPGLVTAFPQGGLKPSKDGRRALFALGYPFWRPHAFIVAFRENAALAGAGARQVLDLEKWECLTMLPTQALGAISLTLDPETDNGGQFSWAVRELDAAGATAFESIVTLPNPGFSKCPQVIEGPAGYYAQSGARILAMNRAAGAGAAPSVIAITPTQTSSSSSFPSLRDRLVAVLGTDFLFEVRDTRTHFVAVGPSGAATRELFALPDTAKIPSGEYSFLAAEGQSVFVTYRNGTAIVLEEIACH